MSAVPTTARPSSAPDMTASSHDTKFRNNPDFWIFEMARRRVDQAIPLGSGAFAAFYTQASFARLSPPRLSPDGWQRRVWKPPRLVLYESLEIRLSSGGM